MSKADTATVRAWAQQAGYEVGDRGRLPAEIAEAYAAAHPVRSKVKAKPAPVPASNRVKVAAVTAPDPVLDHASDSAEWVTLREAAEACRVSVQGIRKAYRAGRIDARMVAGPHGEQREVRLDQVRTALSSRTDRRPAAAPRTPGTDLVPLSELTGVVDRFTTALSAAGNELAEARERAARAEAEAAFLRERLAELRDRPAPEPAPPAPRRGLFTRRG